MDLIRLQEGVLKIRNILLSIGHELGSPFNRFPEACCGDSVLILGAFLKEQGFGTFFRVGGKRGVRNVSMDNWCSHAWAKKDGVIVDITSDQFSDFPGKFVIEGVSAFHDTFNQEGEVQPASFLGYDENTRNRFDRVYQLIMNRYETA